MLKQEGMIRKHRNLWITLFICTALVLTALAAGWNVVLVRDYQRMVELARENFANRTQLTTPWASVIWGSLGFLLALGFVITFFVRLLHEMKLNQAQAEFLASVSHELKTPIAALELTSSLLQSGDLTLDEQNKLWRSHNLELKRLRNEVETLLEAARWQTHKEKLNYSTIQLETWLQEAMNRWSIVLGKDAKLIREGDPLSQEAIVDVKVLNLIADNILDNARKYAKSEPYVRIRTRRELGRWKIEFSDNGWGFHPTDAKNLFTRFFRAKTEAPYAISGTGLGLYLAQTASEALGLKLSGESAGHGQGATFTLEGPERFPSS